MYGGCVLSDHGLLATCNYTKTAHLPKVPAHTGLTILDCRKRKYDSKLTYEFSND